MIQLPIHYRKHAGVRTSIPATNLLTVINTNSRDRNPIEMQLVSNDVNALLQRLLDFLMDIQPRPERLERVATFAPDDAEGMQGYIRHILAADLEQEGLEITLCSVEVIIL